jgi:ABC-type glycerol-3-phosphate transport system substrate-binding protein
MVVACFWHESGIFSRARFSTMKLSTILICIATEENDSMKKMTRRDFIRSAALAAGASVLASCAPAAAPTAQVQPAQPTQALTQAPQATAAEMATAVPTAAAPAAKEPVTIKFQTKWNVKTFQDKIIPMFQEQVPDVKVDLVEVDDAPETVLTSIASGTAPDVFQHYTSSAHLFQLAPKNVFIALDDFIKSSTMIKIDDYIPEQWGGVTVNGKKFALFAFEGGPWPAIGWNKKIFEKAGLDPAKGPKTWDELYALAEKLTKKSADGALEMVGFDPYNSEGAEVRSCSMLCDSPFVDKEKTKILFDQGHWAEMLDFYAKVIKLYGMDKLQAFRQQWATWTFSDNSGFCNDKEGLLLDGSWVPGALPQYMVDKSYEVGWDYMPSITQGKKYVLMAQHHLTVPKTSKVADSAFKWMEWAMTNEQSNLTMFQASGSFQWSKSLVKKYDVAKAPGLDWFLNAPNEADKVFTAADFGTLVAGQIDKLWARALEEVIYGKKKSDQSVKDITSELQTELDTANKALNG